jgi:hypothetical protein
LRLKGLLILWSQVRVMLLLIWWLLKVYMVVNFRAREISWGTRKLARISILIIIIIKNWRWIYITKLLDFNMFKITIIPAFCLRQLVHVSHILQCWHVAPNSNMDPILILNVHFIIDYFLLFKLSWVSE